MLVLPQICFAYPPGCIHIILQLLDPFFLLLLADVHEEFHDQIAVVGQLPLGGIDTGDPFTVGLFRQILMQQGVGDLFHPEGIEELEFACFRNLDNVSVKEGIPFFLFGPGSHSGHLEKAGVDVFDDLADHTAFSGRSPAFKNHHDGQLLFFDLHLIACESFAGLF